MEKLFLESSIESSKRFTNIYSTSFSLGIRSLDQSIHDPIYAIYGFVRVADEIVDTFHEQDKAKLIAEFSKDTFDAIQAGFSSNPILHSFQWVVNNYKIDHELITAFFDSMIMDLSIKTYDRKGYERYIYGSAEVVGLMCLKVFVYPKEEQYKELLEPARKLGSAFQKINFLRDLQADYYEKGRMYFPNLQIDDFTDNEKSKIEAELEEEFAEALVGIKKLPSNCRFGVYTAYLYYVSLLQKIKGLSANHIKNNRVRIPDSKKYALMISSYMKCKFNLL